MGNSSSTTRKRRDRRRRKECRQDCKRDCDRAYRRRRVRNPYACEFDCRPNPYYRRRRAPCAENVEVCDTVCEPIEPCVPEVTECYSSYDYYYPPPCYTPYNQYASSKRVIDYCYPQFEYPYTGYYCKTRCRTYPTFACPTSYRC